MQEAAEILLKQLQQMKAEEKELKKRKKEEKAKSKAARMRTMVVCESSSSSSESSDSECGEVVDMTHLRNSAVANPIEPESQPVMLEAEPLQEPVKGDSFTALDTTSTRIAVEQSEKIIVREVGAKRIEVCMGGKCKRSGGEALLQEFERVVGVEGSVVGCKCMGKCRDGPNIRVLNSIDGVEAEGMDDSVRTPANPLCIGVGLEDVEMIVSNFFGETHQGMAALPAPT